MSRTSPCRADAANPTGTVRIDLFAGMAQVVGRRTVDLPWAGGTAASLRRRLADEFPAIAALVVRSAVAVGDEYVTDDALLPAGAEVAIIPPVSGG